MISEVITKIMAVVEQYNHPAGLWGPDEPPYLERRQGPRRPAAAGVPSSWWVSPWWAFWAAMGSRGQEAQPSVVRVQLEAEKDLGKRRMGKTLSRGVRRAPPYSLPTPSRPPPGQAVLLLQPGERPELLLALHSSCPGEGAWLLPRSSSRLSAY